MNCPLDRGVYELMRQQGLCRPSLGQYLPKGIGIEIYTQNQQDEVATKLNTRPRKTFGFEPLLRYLKKRCTDRLNAPPCKRG